MLIGKYNKSLIISYIGVISAVFGMYFLARCGDLKLTMICYLVAGVCDMFDGMVARMMKRDKDEELFAIRGTPPSLFEEIKGDAFAPRSNYSMKIDFEHEPPYFKVSDTHYAKTWLLHENAPKVEMPKIVSERIRIALEAQKNAAKEGLEDE